MRYDKKKMSIKGACWPTLRSIESTQGVSIIVWGPIRRWERPASSSISKAHFLSYPPRWPSLVLHWCLPSKAVAAAFKSDIIRCDGSSWEREAAAVGRVVVWSLANGSEEELGSRISFFSNVSWKTCLGEQINRGRRYRQGAAPWEGGGWAGGGWAGLCLRCWREYFQVDSLRQAKHLASS